MSAAPSGPAIRLADVEPGTAGNKAARLAALARSPTSLFRVPRGLVVMSDGIDRDALARQANDVLGRGPFAVRSSAAIEDGRSSSCAGQFLTELNVEADHLASAVDRVFASYPASDRGGDCVLIQLMLTPEFAGVLFSRAPDNPAQASLDWVRGGADRLVSGLAAPRTARIGRFTGHIEPALDNDLSAICEQLFLAGVLLEQRFGRPQDIEWAWADGRLWILQSRDITATVDTPEVSSEQLAWLEKLSAPASGPTRLVPSPTDELAPSPTPITRSLLRALYSDAGSLGIALRELGFPGVPGPYLHEVFGRLYMDPDVERRVFGRTPLSWARWALLRRRVRRHPEHWLTYLRDHISSGEAVPTEADSGAGDLRQAAATVVERFDEYVRRNYPAAFVATLLAQAADPRAVESSVTAELCQGLSRLHHTGDQQAFSADWGHRAAIDYELACPRFAEDPAGAVAYAAHFAEFSWASGPDAPTGFLSMKEIAKDRAVAELRALREALLDLGVAATGAADDGFMLGIDVVRRIADGTLDSSATCTEIAAATRRERAWAAIDLGPLVDIDCVETLVGTERVDGLTGTAVGARVGFSGRVRVRRPRLAASERPATKEPEVLLTPTLDPAVVGEFPHTVGCVTNVGGQLSHAAIVAREMGYPVVCLPGCTETLRDGDYVEVTPAGQVTIDRPATSAGTGTWQAQKATG